MHSSIKQVLLIAVVTVIAFPVYADFDEATKAYLLGDFEKARYEALIAATDGSPQAQMLLGQIYFKGEGVEKDLPLAMHWYEKAAANNFDEAQYRLGILYLEGKNSVPKDYNKAYDWLKRAAGNGYRDAEPKLEALYKTDAGKVVNLNESIEVLQQAAEKGEKIARFILSGKLLKGEGIAQDKPRAIKMLTDDAQRGFIKAQKRLGEIYYYGDGIAQDYIEAYGWSMAYAGTNELGGLAREGKQTARSALRKLEEERHNDAYLKSKQYFEQYVLPFHKNAREVGPDKYRIVVRSRKGQAQQVKQSTKPNVADKGGVSVSTGVASATTAVTSPVAKISDTKKPMDDNADRSESDAITVLKRYRGTIYVLYHRELQKNPTMAGKVVLQIDVAPTGLVTKIDKLSSELQAPEFETVLIERIKKINFSAKGSNPLTFTYPIEFSPPDGSGSRTVKLPAVPDSQTEAKGKVAVQQPGAVIPSADIATQAVTTQDVPDQDASKQDIPEKESKSQVKTPQDAKLQMPAVVEDNNSSSNPIDTLSQTETGTEIIQAGQPGPVEGNGKTDDQQAATVAKTEATASDAESTSKADEPIVGQRDFQEVYNVLVRSKSRFNDLYVREYELDKTLQGRVIFDINIAPEGSISSVEVVSNELDSPTLEQDLIDYLKNNVKFGGKNVAPYKITYPMDFLPPAN